MKARAIIGGANFDPNTLKIVYAAFDNAWDEIASQVSSRPDAIEAARLRLAEIVLSLARNGSRDAEALRDAAVNAMNLQKRK
jgi:hypothetical protein